MAKVPAERPVTLESFVPEFVINRLAERGEEPLGPTEELIPAAAMFIDVVGFTAMTEAASSDESAGAEQVSSRLRAAFDELDLLVHTSGGAIVDFVGDGLLAIWQAGDHGSLRGAARAAIGCGNAIQQRVAGDSGAERLKFRIAVGSGDAWLVTAGGHNGSWIPIAGGDAIEQLMPTLHDAWPGEVTLSAETALLLDLEDRLAPRGIVLREPASMGDVVAKSRAVDPATVAPFVPDIVRARFEAGMLESFAEYRRVNAAFVRLRRVDPDDPGRVERIHELTAGFQQAVDDFGGSVVNVLIDDRGTIGIAMWGAALHAHDDDALRAIQSVKALLDRLGESTPAAVASGIAFFGDIGSTWRRQHAVVGTAVNRAARLMELSDGTILCDDETVRLVRRRMAFEERPARELKGLPGKTRVFTPIAELDPDLPGRQPLIGRTNEVAQLTFELETVIAADAKGRLLIIEGESGIGKSRLISHLLGESQRFAIRGVVVRGSQLASTIPYQAWKPALVELLGGESAVPARLEELLPGAPHRRQLVEKILGLSAAVGEPAIPNPDAAREALNIVFSELLERTPTLLVIEDAHWLDLPSWELLGSLLNIPRTLIAVTMRPDAEAQLANQTFLGKAAHMSVIHLGPLTEAETAALVSQRLDVSSLPEDLAKAIVERTEGHPLFTEELTLAVRDEGIIRVDAEGHVTGDVDALINLTYPATVHSTVASRIDQLPLPEQMSLRVASVVGRDFDVASVAAVHSSPTTEDEVRKQLANIERHQLIERLSGDDDYRFKHAIIADVAYGTLPETDRRLIQARVAEWLEDRAGAQPSAVDPAIAQHWLRAGNSGRAVDALGRSAEYAMSIASYQEAIGFLIEAQELDAATASPLQRARRSTSLGAAYRALGDLPASHEALLDAAATLGHPMPRTRPGLWFGLIAQSLRQVAHRLAPRLFASRRIGQYEQIEQVATTYFAMTTTTFSSQDAPALFYVGVKATNEAERIPPSGVLARGYSFLAYGTGTAGLRSVADRYHERGLTAAEASGDSHAAVDVRFNRGVFLTAVGDWPRAGSETDGAIDDFDSLNLAYDSLNAAAVRTYQLLQSGEWDQAEARYQLHRKEADELAEGLHMVWSQVWGDSIAMRQRDLSAAIVGLDDAADLTDQVGELASQIARLGFLSLGLWWAGRPEEALANASESLDLMKRTEWLTAPHAYDGFAATTRVWLAGWERSQREDPGNRQEMQRSAKRACQSMSRLGRSVGMARPGVDHAWGMYQALAGNRRKATRTWQSGLAEAERLGMPYEEALLLSALGTRGDVSELNRRTYRDRARELLERLGAGPDLDEVVGG